MNEFGKVPEQTRTPSRGSHAAAPRRDTLMPPGSADAILAMQRSVGNRAVSRALAQQRHVTSTSEGIDPHTQNQLLRDGLGSAAKQLPEHDARRAQSFYRNDAVAAARLHTGPAAQRAVEAFGAEAITVGTDILLSAKAESDPATIGHELGHVDKNTSGHVETGHDNGAGQRVTDPGQVSERTAAVDGNAWQAGDSVAPSVVARRALTAHAAGDGTERAPGEPAVARSGGDPCPGERAVQRYMVVNPTDSAYPVRGRQSPGGTRTEAAKGDYFDTTADDMFPGQNARPRLVDRPDGSVEKSSYVDASGKPNIEYRGMVSLKLSDNLDLAVESTGADRQAKVFFATDQHIAQANERLRGRVKLERSGSHYLSITRGNSTRTLWQVQPVVTRRRGGAVDRGLTATLAQRCNEVAEQVSGQKWLPQRNQDAYFKALADVLATLKHKKAPTFADYEKAEKSRDAAKFSAVMQRMLEGVLSHSDERLAAAFQKHRLNEYTPPPGIGDVLITTVERLSKKEAGQFSFHMAPVVASSGGDSVTMENYFRGEESGPLSHGDPQWYFAMQGNARSQDSFHGQWGHLDADEQVRLTIVMKG